MVEQLRNSSDIDTQPVQTVQPATPYPNGNRQPVKQQMIPEPGFYCEVCQRLSGPSLFVCQQRKRGACPYRFRRSPHPKRNQGLRQLVVAGIMVMLALIGMLFAALNSQVVVFWASAILIVLAIILAMQGMYRVLWTQELLINPQTRVRWLRRHVLNVALYRQVVTGLMHFPVAQDTQTQYPASIAALYGSASMPIAERAVYLLQVALLGLMTRGLLQLHKTQLFEAGFARSLQASEKNTLTVTPGGFADYARGELERRILESVAQHYRNPVQTEDLSVADLVHHIYQSNEPTPFQELLEWVQRDAINHDFARLDYGHFQFNENARDLNPDGKRVLHIYSIFARTYKDTEIALAAEIKRAVESRRA